MTENKTEIDIDKALSQLFDSDNGSLNDDGFSQIIMRRIQKSRHRRTQIITAAWLITVMALIWLLPAEQILIPWQLLQQELPQSPALWSLLIGGILMVCPMLLLGDES